MSGIFVTPTGFNKKTLALIKSELEDLISAAFGEVIDFDPSGPFGQIVGLLSKREADLWDGAEEIYTSRDPNAATGTSLDNIAAETGVFRIDSFPTKADVILLGSIGTTILAGREMRTPNGSLLYSLDATVVIALATCRDIYLDLDSPSGSGEVYGITLGGTAYSYTTSPGDGLPEILAGLLADIGGGPFAGSAEISGTQLRVFNHSESFAVSGLLKLTADLVGSPGEVTANTPGANTLPANSLTEIVTPVAGWLEVYNPFAGAIGREVETDAELRIRRANAFAIGKSTEEAIRQNILNQVDGIIAVGITSNRSLLTNVDGLPAKSFEVIAEGGDRSRIAEVIWTSMPAGIESYGNINADGSTDPGGSGSGIAIVDSQGYSQTIHYSRPSQLLIFVRVKRAFYSEEAYPVDVDEQIKDAIVAWAAGEFTLGKDVIRQRLSIPIYSVPGVGDILIALDSSTDPLHIPVYAASDIPISARQIAAFEQSRIVVEAL